MSLNELLKTIEDELDSLQIQPSEIKVINYSPEHFGNAKILLKIGAINIIVLRERGNTFIDVSLDNRLNGEVPCDTLFRLLNEKNGLNLDSTTCPGNIRLALQQICSNSPAILKILSQ